MAAEPFEFPKEKKTLSINEEYTDTRECNFNILQTPKICTKVCSDFYQSFISLGKKQGYMDVLYSIKDFGIGNGTKLRHRNNLVFKVQGRVDVFANVYSLKVNAKFGGNKNRLIVKDF